MATDRALDSTEDSEPSLSQMQDRLDALWEKQLHLLDQYDQAQRQLQGHISSGFFSLAQANFKSSSRVRFGQDYYDERMRATRRYTLANDGTGLPQLLSKKGEEDTSVLEQEKAPNSTTEAKEADPVLQEPTPPPTPLHQSDSDHPEKNSEQASEEKTEDQPSKRTSKSSDPVHWYGILVPPALRQSQKSFISIVEGPMFEASHSAQALRRGEVEIRKLRKDIKKAEKKTTTV